MGNTHSTAPYGAQINQISYQLECILFSSLNVSSEPSNTTAYTNLTFSTTSPLTGGSGQSIYYSDLQGVIGVPAFEQDIQNYTSWTVNITTAFELTNADIANVTIQQNMTNPSNVTQLSFTSSPLGPFVLGAVGESHSLQLSGFAANYTFYSSYGAPGLQGGYQCKRPTTLPIVSTTFIDTSTGPALAPSNQGSSVFPFTAIGNKYSLANIPIYCEPNGYRQARPYNLSLAGTVGLAVDRANSGFNIQQVSSYITVPGQAVYSLDSRNGASSDILFLSLGTNHAGPLPGATGLGVTLVNGGPQYFDFASNFSDLPNPLATYRYIVAGNRTDPPIPLPVSGSIDVGQFVITARYPEIFALDSPSFYGYLQGYNTDYGQRTFVGEVPAQCDATTTIRAFSIAIVE